MNPQSLPVLKPVNPAKYLLEAGIWIAGLLALAFINPTDPHLFSLCPFSWFLEDFCPGCGLGHAIAFLFRGEFLASWHEHPLGLPALLLLVGRIVGLIKNYLFLKSYNLTHK